MGLISMDSEQFEKTIATGKVAIVCFFAEWCAPRETVAPVMEELAAFYGDRVIVALVDADSAGYLPIELGIFAMPTTLIYQHGNEMERLSGVDSADVYKQLLNVYLDPDSYDTLGYLS
ncbi:MAG: thioredoxin family protein [Evtepia sp.]